MVDPFQQIMDGHLCLWNSLCGYLQRTGVITDPLALAAQIAATRDVMPADRTGEVFRAIVDGGIESVLDSVIPEVSEETRKSLIA